VHSKFVRRYRRTPRAAGRASPHPGRERGTVMKSSISESRGFASTSLRQLRARLERPGRPAL